MAPYIERIPIGEKNAAASFFLSLCRKTFPPRGTSVSIMLQAGRRWDGLHAPLRIQHILLKGARIMKLPF